MSAPVDPTTPDPAPGPWARNVLPIITGVGTFLTTLWPVLAAFGVRFPAALPEALTPLVGSAFLLAALIYSRLRTTPLVDPVDALGRKLVPQRTGGITRPGNGGVLGSRDTEG